MDILVCVKRVPTVGGAITVSGVESLLAPAHNETPGGGIYATASMACQIRTGRLVAAHPGPLPQLSFTPAPSMR